MLIVVTNSLLPVLGGRVDRSHFRPCVSFQNLFFSSPPALSSLSTPSSRGRWSHKFTYTPLFMSPCTILHP